MNKSEKQALAVIGVAVVGLLLFTNLAPAETLDRFFTEDKIIWQTDWDNLVVPEWVVLFEPNGISLENGMLKLTANLATEIPSRRARVYFRKDNPLPDEYYMKAVFLLPADLPTQNWLTFFEPLNEHPIPHMTSQIGYNADDSSVTIGYRNTSESGWQPYEKQWSRIASIDLGVPFEVIFHVKRHRTEGILEYWINRRLVVSYQGRTLWDDYFSRTECYNIPIIADNYKDVSEATCSVYQDSFAVAHP